MKSDMSMRFAFIESRVYWGNGFTAQQLATAFGLSRPHAQTVIDRYNQLHPNALWFDAKRRRQVAGPDFRPNYIRATTTPFLDHLRGQAMMAHYLENADLIDVPFEDVERLLIPRLQRHPLQKALQGLYEQKTVVLHYRAKTGANLREISPHHLVFASNRYHLRAFCHMTRYFLDFSLSRILYSELSTTPWVSARDDEKWNEFVTLCFRLNPDLSQETQEALRCDFGLNQDDSFSVSCRKAVTLYVRRSLLAVDEQLKMPRWIERADND